MSETQSMERSAGRAEQFASPTPAELEAVMQQKLDEFDAWLIQHPELRGLIDGYTGAKTDQSGLDLESRAYAE